MKTLRSKTYPGVTWVPKAEALAHQLADLRRRASKGRAAALRHASRPDVPPPPSSREARAERGDKLTVEERMAVNAERARRSFRVTPLEAAKAGVPEPPDLATYVRARSNGASHSEAAKEARR